MIKSILSGAQWVSSSSSTGSRSANSQGVMQSRLTRSTKRGRGRSKQQGALAELHVFAAKDPRAIETLLKGKVPAWLIEPAKWSANDLLCFEGLQGLVFVFTGCSADHGAQEQGGLLAEGPYSIARDRVGSVLPELFKRGLYRLQVSFHDNAKKVWLGTLVGLELSAYSARVERRVELEIVGRGSKQEKAWLEEAKILGQAVNLARSLVNQSPSHLHPVAFADLAKNLFKGRGQSRVQVWDEKKLAHEKMNLLLAVGRAAEHPPRMVHIRYRPKKKTKKAPLAFVGKGVTFDTGGLDLKPAGAMRWMKKDMGGAASVLALAYWIDQTGLDIPCDFYLALAENSVDARSFRPGDILTSRRGLQVEIHNTDAEGRLVLADVLDVAVSAKGKDAPEVVIDLATLTGACRVALGADVAGLFSNSDELAENVLRSAARHGDWMWRLPLVKSYEPLMKSSFADMTNAVDGFGGAITAALFLQKFVGDTPWVHVDMYSWTDKPKGALQQQGGNGQAVQALAGFLTSLSSS